MNALQTHILRIKSSVAYLESFIEKYGEKLPDGIGIITLGYSSGCDPCYSLYLGHQTAENRLRGLQMMGDVFGRDGWTSTPRLRNDSCFDWQKVADGVKLDIYGAEVMPRMVPMPVHPTKFPLQLEDSE